MTEYTLREIQPSDRAVVTKLLVEAWGAAEVYAVAYGGMVDASPLPGWLAEQDSEIAGLLTYRVTGTIADIVTINAFRSGGVGAALVDRLAAAAPGLGATRIRVVTTNDNTRALRVPADRTAPGRDDRGTPAAQAADPGGRQRRHPDPRRARVAAAGLTRASENCAEVGIKR